VSRGFVVSGNRGNKRFGRVNGSGMGQTAGECGSFDFELGCDYLITG
jgi:hypothetical protein